MVNINVFFNEQYICVFLPSVIKVTNEIGFERTIGGLARIGNLSVTTVPVTALDTYAQRLGINTHNIYNHQQIFPKDNIFYWAVDLQFSGE